jgi:AAA+ ATPase superfamily predicted ATPase
MNLITIEQLLVKRINKMKKKLILIAQETGMTSSQTIKCSQDLDILINLHMKYFSSLKSNQFISA